MSIDFSKGFATRAGQQEFLAIIAGFIRQDRHEKAISELCRHIHRYPSPVAQAVELTEPSTVRIEGWEALNIAITDREARGQACTAVGATLSSAAAGGVSPEGWIEPLIACGFYTDRAYPFSGASQATLISASAEPTPPWQGAMEYAGGLLETFGLARLNSALAAHSPRHWPAAGVEREPAPDAVVAYLLGGVLVQVLFHRAIKQGLERHGLVRRLPLLVGSGDTAAPFRTAYFTTTLFVDTAAARAHYEARKAQAKAIYEAYTRDQIELLRKRREMIRKWDAHGAKPYRDTYVGFVALHEQSLLSAHRISARGRTWELPDDQFEDLLDAFQTARHPDYDPASKGTLRPWALLGRLGFGGRRAN
jgi:hypothetical protein